MRLKRVVTMMVLAGAVTLGGMAVFPTSALAAPPKGDINREVQAVPGWVSEGIFPNSDCQAFVTWYKAHRRDAYCWWHPPIQSGYSELMVWY